MESKQDIKEKRMQARMSAGKTEDVSRVNGKPNCMACFILRPHIVGTRRFSILKI